MNFFLLAVLTAFVGIIPLLGAAFKAYGRDSSLARANLIAACFFFFVAGTLFWLIFYLYPPALYEAWWGSIGIWVIIMWVICPIIAGIIEETITWIALFPAALIIVFFISFVLRSTEWLNAKNYSELIGPVEERVWTQDVQPKHPGHIRTNATDNAIYMAKQAINSAGPIGSQFHIDQENATLQKIGNQFWYIVPLDHVGWSTWRHTMKVPGYIRVSGEDPNIAAELVLFTEDQKLVYTPGAYWENNLERHIWASGYANTGTMSYMPEVDENGKFWYVVTTFKYAVNGWDGRKVTGVLIVDPVTGEIKKQPLGSIDEWADRVIPHETVQKNLEYKGMYPKGDYWNTVSTLGGAREKLTTPENSNMVFGADGELYWVNSMKSVGDSDSSMVGLYYTNTRTGRTIFYEAAGSTDTAILKAINKHKEVQMLHLHGVAPQIYNILGAMTAIIPMMNENSAFQGIGLVKVKDLQIMSFGANQEEVYEKYQVVLQQSGHQIAPELERTRKYLEGIVDRFFPEIRNGSQIFYVHLQNVPHLFTGTSNLSPKLRLTQPGDRVAISYVATGSDVEPMREFDIPVLPLNTTEAQEEVRSQGRSGMQRAEDKENAATARKNAEIERRSK